MAHKVFISYSSKDKPVADAACAALESQRIPCWIAPRDILAGDEYGDAIIDAISTCQIVVVIFSLHANDSPQVRREVERAVAKGKIIVPYRIEDVLPTHAMEFALSNTHWLDALTPPLEHRLTELCETVARIIQRHAVVEPLWQQGEPSPAKEPVAAVAEIPRPQEIPQPIVVELPSAVEELHRAHEAAAEPVAPAIPAAPIAAVAAAAPLDHPAAKPGPAAVARPAPPPAAPIAPAPLPFPRTPAGNAGGAGVAQRAGPPTSKLGLIIAGVAVLIVVVPGLLYLLGSKAPQPAGAVAAVPSAAQSAAPAAGGAASGLATATAPEAHAAVAEPVLSDAGSQQRDLWLSKALYGGDNEMAKSRLVTIEKGADGYVVSIANQFGFSCGLHFNQAGDPATLTDCVSKGQPEWTADEKTIPLSCTRRPHEVICQGSYTLRTTNLAQPSTLRLGYKS
jgi:hypothetical protein